jgi:hypothetical protein
MATEGHAHGGKKIHQQQENIARDKELAEIRESMDEIALWVQHNTKSIWVYECPMKMKVKWSVRELVVRRQQRLLKAWLRHAENLNGPEEEIVQVCELEAGRNLSDIDDEQRSAEGLRDCHVCLKCKESREEIPNFQ